MYKKNDIDGHQTELPAYFCPFVVNNKRIALNIENDMDDVVPFIIT